MLQKLQHISIHGNDLKLLKIAITCINRTCYIAVLFLLYRQLTVLPINYDIAISSASSQSLIMIFFNNLNLHQMIDCVKIYPRHRIILYRNTRSVTCWKIICLLFRYTVQYIDYNIYTNIKILNHIDIKLICIIESNLS